MSGLLAYSGIATKVKSMQSKLLSEDKLRLDLYILSQRNIWNLQHRFHNILKNYKKNSYNLCKFYIQNKKNRL